MRVLATSLILAAMTFAAVESTEAQRWWSHIVYLADDKLEGRDTGSPGYRKAADYVAQQFQSIGLKPAGTKGFFQTVPLKSREILEPNCSLSLRRDGKSESLKLGEDAYFSLRVEPAKHVEAEAVFVGYGLRIPELGYDDLAGLDLHGKIAVYLSGAPKSIPGPLAAHSQSGAERWKNLRNAGAVGTAAFSNPKHTDIPWARASLARFLPAMSLADPNLDDTKGHIISIVINSQNADKFLAGTGHTAAELIAFDDAQKPLPKFPLKVKIDATIDYTSKTVESDNVIGVLPGSDPKLKTEYVVLGAHLDHIGVGKPINGDSINNGAMDDASGIATLIEVARGLAATPGKLKRSVMFLAVCGEEKGLLGSKYFASHPTVKAESMIADINSDMFLPLIPLREVTVYGIDESTLGDDFREVAKEFGIKIQPDAQPERNVFIRSDQYNFILHGVPAVFTKFSAPPGSPESKILSDWIHTRYHSPSDDINQPVDKEAAVQFDRLMAALTRKVANQAEHPQWKPTSFFRRFAKPS